MKKTIFIICLLLAVSLILPACGEVQEEPPVDLVTFVSQDVSISPGDTYQLECKAPKGKTITYTSSDETVLTVDANGLVTGISAGTAIVTASTGEYEKAYLEITVEKNLMTALVNAVLNAEELQLLVGMEYDLALEVQKVGEEVSYSADWKSSNDEVVTVTNGKLSAVGEGNAVVTVTVTAEEETIVRYCNVLVYPRYRVEIQEERVTGYYGMEYSLNFNIYDANGNVVTPAADEIEMITSDASAIEVRGDAFKIIGASDVSAGVRYKGNVTYIPVDVFTVTAEFFKDSASNYAGNIGGEAFNGILLSKDAYKPYFYLTDAACQMIRDFAAANDIANVKIHCYAKDSALLVNNTVTIKADTWTTVDLAIEDINAEFNLRGQNVRYTEVYVWLEFIKLN